MRKTLGGVLVVATAAVAQAGGDRAAATIKGHVECYVYVPADDGADLYRPAKRIRPKKKVAIPAGSELTCRYVVDRGVAPAGATAMFVIRQGGEILDTPWGHQLVDDGGAAYVGLDKPLERRHDFAPCAPFSISASLHDGSDPIAGAKDLKITPKCPKPPPEQVDLYCTTYTEDGVLYEWPGNGETAKPEIVDPLQCDVSIATPVGDPSQYKVVVNGVVDPEGLRQTSSASAWVASVSLQPDADFAVCSKLTVKATVTDADGQTVWSGKRKIVQSCPRAPKPAE